MGKSKVACGCKHVTKDEIREAVREGATTFKDVKRATGAGSKCGKCRKKIEKIIEDELEEMEKEAEKMAAATLGNEEAPAEAAEAADTSEPDAQTPQAAAEPAPAEEAPSFPADITERAKVSPQQELKVGGIYRHFKGDYYLVEETATGSEDGKQYVIYRKLYGDGALWIRPEEMFLSPVDRTRYPDVAQNERFCLMDVASVRGR
jgi:bacterioferritin-associated ferredoxin